MRAGILALLLVSLPARADDVAEAQRHFVEGDRRFTAGDYDAAVEEYLTAYRMKPHPSVLISIATSYERIYKPREARAHYERFLTEAPESAEFAEQRRFAENRLRVLRSLPGRIVVESTKPGAKVRLTGEGRDLSGLTPAKFDDLPPGRYHIHIALGYHTPADVEVTLAPGEQDVVNVPLEREVETLTVFSRPDGARVLLDDREEGVTPFSRPVGVGKRRLRLEKEDFPPHHEELDVVRGRPVRRDVVLKRPLRTGRSELVLGAMLYGGLAGIGIAEAAGNSELSGVVRLSIDLGTAVAGVGIGALVSILTSDDYVRVGSSSSIIGATVWGTALGASLGVGLHLTARYTLGVSLLGGALGLGAGLAIARWVQPSAGDAAVVNSGGTWGAATGMLLAGAIGFGDRGREALGWLAFSGCAVGIAAGTLLAWRLEISRGHVAIIDATGLAGLALAFTVGYGVGSEARLETGSRFGLGGLAAGLVAGAILSRRYQDDVPPTEALVTHHHGRWALGIPRLDVAPDRAAVILARGEF